ncbi:MAG: hypothetical protein ACRDYX_23625, partial [Egibacteraceae bacterium]
MVQLGADRVGVPLGRHDRLGQLAQPLAAGGLASALAKVLGSGLGPHAVGRSGLPAAVWRHPDRIHRIPARRRPLRVRPHPRADIVRVWGVSGAKADVAEHDRDGVVGDAGSLGVVPVDGGHEQGGQVRSRSRAAARDEDRVVLVSGQQPSVGGDPGVKEAGCLQRGLDPRLGRLVHARGEVAQQPQRRAGAGGAGLRGAGVRGWWRGVPAGPQALVLGAELAEVGLGVGPEPGQPRSGGGPRLPDRLRDRAGALTGAGPVLELPHHA